MIAPIFDLSGRVALVTGGNGGIGRAIALAFAAAGARVAILGRNADKNEAVLAELQPIAQCAVALQADLADRGQLAAVVPQVEAELGPLDILVNNAGVAGPGGILDIESATWDRILETNLTAPLLLTQQAAQSMVKRRRGKVINVSSIGGLVALPPIAYTAAKAALLHVTRCAARELGPYNVQVNAIAPGFIRTDMTRGAHEGPRYERIVAATPAGRFAETDELAGTAVYLASPASDFVTGSVLVADGGLSLGGFSRPEAVRN